MIIAIDGPAGAGKSTVCRLLAEKLGFLYLDTGAMYRAVAWALLQRGHMPAAAEIAALLPQIPLRFGMRDEALEIRYESRRLDTELRGPEISEQASRVSRLEPVREYLVDWQRRLAQQGSVVAEGRDTATVVFPHADIKIFLTADLPIRAARREAEYIEKGIQADFSEVLERMRSRDAADAARDLAPLRPADDAVIVDTSRIGAAQVVEELLEIVRARTGSNCAAGYTECDC
jgi:CMP/dCMP kinase